VVLVPAFNEAETIEETVRNLKGAAPGVLEKGLKLRVFVVDDGSKDGTGGLAEKAGADRVLRHRVNRGLGAAVRTGLMAARSAGARIAVKFDADLQHDPADIAELVEPILLDEAEVVYGNRFGQIEYRMPFVRRCGNLAFTKLMRWLTRWPLKDSQPGIFAVSRAYLEVFHLPGDYNYTQQVLLDAYHKGMRFAHVPVRFRKRGGGRSFVSLRYPLKVLPQLFMVIVSVRPLRVFGPLGLVSLLIGASVFGYEIVDWMRGNAPKPVVHVNAVLGFTLFGLQTLFFGVLAELVVGTRRRF
jgi:glycosyltransferase involved in cell wall biosynthesis